MATRSDLDLRDTPALGIVEARPDDFPGVDTADLADAQLLLRVAKRVLGAFNDEFVRNGLSPGRYSVLMCLEAESGPLAPSEIAERAGVTRATVTGLVSGLEDAGLLGFVPAPSGDKRRKAVELTGKGRALLHGLLPGLFGEMCGLVSGLTRTERGQMRTILAKVEAGLGQDKEA